MIHVIGTSHSLQVWSDARRANSEVASRMRAFETYLAGAVMALQAEVIAEENDAEFVDCHGPGASSVAMDVAQRLGLQHVYCDADRSERRAMGLKFGSELVEHAMAVARRTGEDWNDVWQQKVRDQFPVREAAWIERLNLHGCAGREVVFVCGADHATSFKGSLEAADLAASVYCADWTEL